MCFGKQKLKFFKIQIYTTKYDLNLSKHKYVLKNLKFEFFRVFKYF